MILHQLKVGSMENFSYILADESKEALAIDPGWDIDKILTLANKGNLRIKKVILAHSHFDHVQKCNELAIRTGAEVYFHEFEAQEIKKLLETGINTHFLKDGDEIALGKIKIKVIHTPGHTQGSICLLIENKLLTGDTLFVSAIGRTDLSGGNAAMLFDSLEKLKKLDDSTEVYPGHDYGDTPSSTIGIEKRSNPYMMAATKEKFLDL